MRLSAVIFCIYSVCCFGQNDVNNDMIWIEKANYKIQCPQTWIIDSTGVMGTKLVLLSEYEDDADRFRDNVNVVIQNLAGQGIDLKKYAELSEKQMEGFVSQLFESKLETGVQGEYYKVIYTVTQGKFQLKIKSICFIRNEQAYLITFTSEQSKFDKYFTIGEKIMDSLVLKEN
jgi:serine/threonine-protein kinase